MEGETGEKGSVCGSSEGDVIGEMMEVIENVGSYVGFRRTQRKESLNLVRRLKLLVPLLEELRELGTAAVSGEALGCLARLKKALVSAKKLLKNCNYGSKIYLVCLFFSTSHTFLQLGCVLIQCFFCFLFFLRHMRVRQWRLDFMLSTTN